MKLPKLYSRTSTGAVQQWEVEYQGDWYRTTYGQVGGSLVTTEPSYCTGKNIGKSNETSPSDQAKKEAEALWKKKKKEKYYEDVNDIDNTSFIEPMRAKGFSEYKNEVTYPMAWEDKLNGIRCVITKDGAFSRRGEQFFTIEHIKDELAPLFEKYPDLMVDGELFNPKLRNELGEISSLVSVQRKKKDVTQYDIDRSKELVQYHVYDGLNFEGVTTDTPFVQRKAALEKLINGLTYIVYHPYGIVNSYDDILALMEKVEEENREGLMLKNLDGKYEFKRSKNFLKCKLFKSDEFKFVKFLDGTGNWAGIAKTAVLELKEPATDGRTTFETNLRGKQSTLRKIWEEREKYNDGKTRMMTCDFQEYSPYGVPLINYSDPIFRDYE